MKRRLACLLHVCGYPLDMRPTVSVAPPRVAPATAPETSVSAVSWPAILVGAAAAGALSLVLVILGLGLGLSAISPWQGAGASAKALSAGAIVWISFTQLAASALGGYLAGRLRVKWSGLHTDEVYFRDTAHGFMAWAVASLVTAAFLSAAVGTLLSTGATASAAIAGQRSTPSVVDASVDSLLRRDPSQAGAPISAATREETVRIFAAGLSEGALRADDRQYLAAVVSQQAGIAPAEANKRVDDRFNEARNAVDQGRKIASNSSLWFFVALMLGAFFASLAATFGGRRRDAME